MTFVEARNAIIFGLENHLGCPVVLSEQIADVSDFPYSYYSVLASRISDHAFGLRGVVQETPDGYTLKRSEPVKASLSFTFCSENRESPDGYIFGEDEALELAEKAHRYFLLDAHNIITDTGEVVINNVGSVANRKAVRLRCHVLLCADRRKADNNNPKSGEPHRGRPFIKEEKPNGKRCNCRCAA